MSLQDYMSLTIGAMGFTTTMLLMFVLIAALLAAAKHLWVCG